MDTVEPDSFHYIVIGIGHNASGKMRANQNTYGVNTWIMVRLPSICT